MKSVLIRGVPTKMQQDGWWLSPSAPECKKTAQAGSHALWQLGLLLALVAIGDALMWGVVPGLSLAIFAALCVAAALAMWPKRPSGRQVFIATAGTALSVLPLVELVQPLSILVAMTGLPATLAVIAGRRALGSFRFWWAAPWFSVTRAVKQRVSLPPGAFRQFVLGWTLPLAVGCVFAGLLVLANPVLDGVLNDLLGIELSTPHLGRILLWALLALLLWPLLHLARFASRLSPEPQPARFGPFRGMRVVNGVSIIRALVLFNAMFAVQNAMDAVVLLGGAGLPQGMGYAEYAHRGAYPLLVLALLSGGFALLARPFITAAPILRTLLLLWVAQTVWLTCSSILRLDLYVDVYGLTRMRVAAAIWMGLVLSGLLLILWQIAYAYPNGWLVRCVGAIGGGVLYLCCFVNIDGVIARYNLSENVRLDPSYLCALSAGAAPALLAAQPGVCDPVKFATALDVSTPRDWREWGFRNARVRHTLASMTTPDAHP